jgi:hypothetical protein
LTRAAGLARRPRLARRIRLAGGRLSRACNLARTLLQGRLRLCDVPLQLAVTLGLTEGVRSPLQRFLRGPLILL